MVSLSSETISMAASMIERRQCFHSREPNMGIGERLGFVKKPADGGEKLTIDDVE
jgi:hypothetical protein